MQVNVDNENFDVLAVNDQMQVLWRTSCTGYAFKVVKFKDKVVAIASTDHGKIKGSNNTYKAFLIDPANGKLPLAYHAGKNKFYVVNNNKTGINKIFGMVGCLDLSSGKWDKMDLLSKKKIDNSCYLNSAAVMWFANNYIVPYVSASGQAGGKGDMTLQQNNY